MASRAPATRVGGVSRVMERCVKVNISRSQTSVGRNYLFIRLRGTPILESLTVAIHFTQKILRYHLEEGQVEQDYRKPDR